MAATALAPNGSAESHKALAGSASPGAPMTPMQMLNSAIERGADMDVLEKLMALQERWEANQARKAFDEAVSAAKAELKPVVRTAKGHNGKKYADFASIATAIDPVLKRHGLNYRFRSSQENNAISVTCRLSHKDGHGEETTLTGPPDNTGNKNAIQAIGSTTMYLQRYTLVLSLGLATSEDDDGRAASGAADAHEPISPSQLDEILKLADDIGADKQRFCKFYGIGSFAEITKANFEKAKRALEAKRK